MSKEQKVREAELTMKITRGRFIIDEEVFLASNSLRVSAFTSSQVSGEYWSATAYDVAMLGRTINLSDPVTIEIKALGVEWILMGEVTGLESSISWNPSGAKSTKVLMKGRGPLW